MSNACQHLAQVFAQDIPLSQVMGGQVTHWSNTELQLTFPLQPNINHQASMFLYVSA